MVLKTAAQSTNDRSDQKNSIRMGEKTQFKTSLHGELSGFSGGSEPDKSDESSRIVYHVPPSLTKTNKFVRCASLPVSTLEQCMNWTSASTPASGNAL